MFEIILITYFLFTQPLPDFPDISIQKPTEIVQEKPTTDVPIMSSPFVNRLNEVRAQNGLKPLLESDELDASAQAWANTMSVKGYGHSDFGWEVVAYSCGLFTDVLQEWLDSPPHRKIILGDFTYIGYGQTTSGDCDYYVGQVK